jgi:hypothetical protein
MCVSNQVAIVSLYNTKWHIFLSETEYVYRTVQTDSLKIIEFKLSLQIEKFFHIEFFLYLQTLKNESIFSFLLPSDAGS